ncbi:hypothetical protein ACH5RR_015177 [Cinchona calisaya]|uniref:Uncharacterized protein n=1 Tax=Cinchona calisaya TaxID=153742 RepID=A0ABD2ZST9_9GENT
MAGDDVCANWAAVLSHPFLMFVKDNLLVAYQQINELNLLSNDIISLLETISAEMVDLRFIRKEKWERKKMYPEAEIVVISSKLMMKWPKKITVEQLVGPGKKKKTYKMQ